MPQKTINAREGITTIRLLSGVVLILGAVPQKTINAREGITTGKSEVSNMVDWVGFPRKQ